MKRALSDLLFASLAGDALALGVHWIYDQELLEKTFGRVVDFRDPLPDSYHPGKRKGDLTHYGDQTLVLLHSLHAQGQFDFADFAERWRTLWKNHGGYRDHATRDTLEALEKGTPPGQAGSDSEELGGAARLAPLLVAHADHGLDDVVAAARSQTRLTHRSPAAQDSAEYLTRVVFAVLKAMPVREALEAGSRSSYQALDLAGMVQRARDTALLEPRVALKEGGLACPASQALAGVVWLAWRFPEDLETALIENAMAGGDSAARGLALGMILGAAGGRVPERWKSGLQCAPDLTRFLEKTAAR